MNKRVREKRKKIGSNHNTINSHCVYAVTKEFILIKIFGIEHNEIDKKTMISACSKRCARFGSAHQKGFLMRDREAVPHEWCMRVGKLVCMKGVRK